MLERIFSGDIVSVVWVVVSAAVALILGAALQHFFSTKSLRYVLIAITLFMVLCGAILLGAVQQREQLAAIAGKMEHATLAGRGDAIVVAIYPSDVYGPSQRYGLHAGLAPYARTIRIVDITAPYADLKGDNAPQVLSQLRDTLTHRNVIAVVGPGVTEFSRSMVHEVERSGLKPPVFVTGSTSRDAVGWMQARVPLFRINSGIDERAHDFVELAQTAIAQHIPVVFLVETNVNSDQRTYGQVLLDHIIRETPHWTEWTQAGLVVQRSYERGALVAEVGRWDADAFLGRRQLVMMLGAGNDYGTLVHTYYLANQPARTSVIGGWMNAYSIEPTYRRERFQWRRMFELTDVVATISTSTSGAARFTTEFGPFTPALRDQAVLFDAGTAIATAFEDVTQQGQNAANIHADNEFLGRLAQSIAHARIDGVTGPIEFNSYGQNVGLARAQGHGINYVQYQSGPPPGWRLLEGPGAVVAIAAEPAAAPAAPAP